MKGARAQLSASFSSCTSDRLRGFSVLTFLGDGSLEDSQVLVPLTKKLPHLHFLKPLRRQERRENEQLFVYIDDVKMSPVYQEDEYLAVPVSINEKETPMRIKRRNHEGGERNRKHHHLFTHNHIARGEEGKGGTRVVVCFVIVRCILFAFISSLCPLNTLISPWTRTSCIFFLPDGCKGGGQKRVCRFICV